MTFAGLNLSAGAFWAYLAFGTAAVFASPAHGLHRSPQYSNVLGLLPGNPHATGMISMVTIHDPSLQ